MNGNSLSNGDSGNNKLLTLCTGHATCITENFFLIHCSEPMEESEERDERYEMIIRESIPEELSPDVVRCM